MWGLGFRSSSLGASSSYFGTELFEDAGLRIHDVESEFGFPDLGRGV